MNKGNANVAPSAGPSSPQDAVVGLHETPGVPNTVAILPGAMLTVPNVSVEVPMLTARTTRLFESVIYRFPELSSAMPLGAFNMALVAGPPSPLNPAAPVP